MTTERTRHAVLAELEAGQAEFDRLNERQAVARMTVIMYLVGGDRDMDEAVRDAISALEWLGSGKPVPANLPDVWPAVDAALALRAALAASPDPRDKEGVRDAG